MFVRLQMWKSINIPYQTSVATTWVRPCKRTTTKLYTSSYYSKASLVFFMTTLAFITWVPLYSARTWVVPLSTYHLPHCGSWSSVLVCQLPVPARQSHRSPTLQVGKVWGFVVSPYNGSLLTLAHTAMLGFHRLWSYMLPCLLWRLNELLIPHD